uniref:Uncharacterized protein n=1 Tax=viral metagenome TaxID=1070528 RepID=A0A6M3L6S3_9ZZZZ
MGTTALSVLRQKFNEEIAGRDGWRTGTTTGAGSSTTAADTVLADKGDDFYNDTHFILLTSGTYATKIRPVSDFTSTGGIVTWTAALAGASGSGVTYELSIFHPDDVKRCLNAAALEAFPYLRKRIIDESLISGNWLRDPGFEDWSSTTALYHWQAVGTATFAQGTSIYGGRLYGSKVAIVTSVAANDGIKQSTATNDSLIDLRGHSITFRAVLAGASGDAVIRITDSDGTTTSSAVSALATWETLSVTRTISSTTKVVTFDAISPNNQSFYIDNARTFGKEKYDYVLPTFLINVNEVNAQVMHEATYPCDDMSFVYPPRPIVNRRIYNDGTYRTLQILEPLIDESKLQIIGSGYLSTLAADTTTVEIDGDEVNVLIALAVSKWYQMQSGMIGSESSDRFSQLSEKWYQEYLRRRNRHCSVEPYALPRIR